MVLVMKMQSNVVKAFRQRLVRGGFKNVRITNLHNGFYAVRFIPPLGSYYIYSEISEVTMSRLPRISWHPLI